MTDSLESLAVAKERACMEVMVNLARSNRGITEWALRPVPGAAAAAPVTAAAADGEPIGATSNPAALAAAAQGCD